MWFAIDKVSKSYGGLKSLGFPSNRLSFLFRVIHMWNWHHAITHMSKAEKMRPMDYDRKKIPHISQRFCRSAIEHVFQSGWSWGARKTKIAPIIDMFITELISQTLTVKISFPESVIGHGKSTYELFISISHTIGHCLSNSSYLREQQLIFHIFTSGPTTSTL
jgi:hypothetical protein